MSTTAPFAGVDDSCIEEAVGNVMLVSSVPLTKAFTWLCKMYGNENENVLVPPLAVYVTRALNDISYI